MVLWPPARGRGPGSRSGGPSPRRTRRGSCRSMTRRRPRDTGAVSGLADKPAGRPGRSTEAVEIERLRRENEKLTVELTRTKAALEVVGKAHALLELLSESADSSAKRNK